MNAPVREHDTEPLIGLPETLPVGEQLLWQGSPEFLTFARRVFHINKIVLWFMVIALWRTLEQWRLTGHWSVDGWSAPMIALVLVLTLLLSLSWLYARSTVYTITNRRVVMRFGLAVPVTMNIPFSQIDSANVSAFAKDRGNIALKVRAGTRVSHLVLWPNVRPWHWINPQPMLCCISNFHHVSQQLRSAVMTSASTAPVSPPARPLAAQHIPEV